MAKIYSLISLIALFALPFVASASNLSISPATISAEVGERVIFRVIVSGNQPLNAVSGVISLPPAYFSIESVTKAGSILNFWVSEPTFSKSAGTVSFEGVTLGGFNGSTGTIVTVTARALAVGSGDISFQSGQVLANDGQGTDITESRLGAAFTIKEATEKPKPAETIKPDETKTEPEAEEPEVKKTLNTPEIVLGEIYGEPAILGESNHPGGQALFMFINSTGAKIYLITTADSDGKFSVLVPEILKYGAYKVTVVMVKENGERSEASNEIVVSIGNWFSDMSWPLVAILIILLLGSALVVSKIAYRKGRQIPSKIKREVGEAEKTVHASFDILREDLQVKDLEKSVDDLKKDINDAEKAISKEINDIKS